MELSNQALINDGSSALYPDYLMENFKMELTVLNIQITDLFCELFRTAVIQSIMYQLKVDLKNIFIYSLNF